MPISQITREAVLRAIAEYDELGRTAFLNRHGYLQAQTYFLDFDGRTYDSKAIVGAAHGYAHASAAPLKSHEFSGGDATVVRLLKRLGFEIYVSSRTATKSAGSHRYWWVNHKQTFAQEVGGNYIWSPVGRSDGGRNEFYENMKRVQPGDIVFSFAGAQIRAVGVCQAPAFLAAKPEEFGTAGKVWQDVGWQVSIRFARIPSPIRPKDHMAIIGPALPKKYAPIKLSGDGNQGAYLASIPPLMADAVINLIGEQWNNLSLQLALTAEEIAHATAAEEELVGKSIENRTDIGETRKLQLIWSRRGQGAYRQNLEHFESGCRVTGVSDPRHLRASHIKPWRVCNDYEKIDGNNGLLLSPHVDHLFDRGFISFLDDGTMLIGGGVERAMLGGWGIDYSRNCGIFRTEQLSYIAFHREFIFQSTAADA